MKLYFSKTVTGIGLVLIALMLRASYWQWERHLEKQAYIQELDRRLAMPIVLLGELLSRKDTDWDILLHRRVLVQGQYDFQHEMVLRNRRHDDKPGVFVLTPMKLSGDSNAIIVSRGFLPLDRSSPEARKEFQHGPEAQFVGLIKAPVQPRFFLAPQDPDPAGGWVDAWLRVDVERMQQQLPYPVLPFFVEVMSTVEHDQVKELMIQSKSGRDELLLLPLRADALNANSPSDAATSHDLEHFPVPVFDTVIPPGRHFGYVFEWALMALVTLLICIILQLRPRRFERNTAKL